MSETVDLPEAALRAAYLVASRLMESLLHDARNPLNAVAINLEVVAEKLKDDEGKIPESVERNLKSMREQVYRVDAILREFSDFIAPRLGTSGDLELGPLLSRALEVVGHEARKRRVKVAGRASIPPPWPRCRTPGPPICSSPRRCSAPWPAPKGRRSRSPSRATETPPP